MKVSTKKLVSNYFSKTTGEGLPLVSELIAYEISIDDSLQGLNFRGNSSNQKVEDTISAIFQAFSISTSQPLIESDNRMSNDVEKRLVELGLDFIQAVDSGDFQTVQKFLDFDFPVNFQHPKFLETALHRVAGMQGDDAIKMVDLLSSTGKVDYLLKDSFGKYAVDNALICGEIESAEILSEPTRKASKLAGLDYDSRQVDMLVNWHGRLPE